MKLAKKEMRIILTFDKDFSNFPIEKHNGIILLRYTDKSSKNAVDSFVYLLNSPIKEKFENCLCEVFDNCVKIHKS